MGKRQDIMDATLDLIHEEGLQSVTFSKIFKKADVGSGTIYNYFSNKEELVNAVYKEARMLMGGIYATRLRSDGKPLRAV
ncbi:TetR/AcrR family transcriptional regulator [Cohnella rhizosphaerae]|uniref:TetR/AcrR family transcriptional regulator n=1 Tax=Cohnella rhizosphaerae TaxID=1457232 RepID=A0A9X4QVU2_9BACL|nr:TetR/AcrR family transcriptional regulator [Cohnella rhizosphaerae]MDG0812818.1 TetR/AcrR family transcriptional regulator [Cohnella rhizosphaerae]